MELRYISGRDDVPILIDQEGGRVSRLKPPHWPKYPPARAFGTMYEIDPEWGTEAMRLYARIVAHELHRLGIDVNCAPVVDLFMDGATPAIGDRALSRKPGITAALARLWAETFLGNGVLPVIKHFPGHGRMIVDPHHHLPTIDSSRVELESDDFVPFELLKDLPLGMTSHAIFSALDPHHPASLSPVIHQDIIRGRLGFDGLIFSDDICMKALDDTAQARTMTALDAGTDIVLHCNSDLDEMRAIASVLTPIKYESQKRWDHAKTMVQQPDAGYNPLQDMERLDVLLGGLAWDLEAAV